MFTRETWNQYAAPTLAAGAAMGTTYPFLVWKSAYQRGKKPFQAVTIKEFWQKGKTPFMKVPVKECFFTGSLVCGGVIGAQIVVRDLFLHGVYAKTNKEATLKEKMAASLFAATLSIYPLAVINGHSQNMTAKEVWRSLCRRQVTAIFAREAGFLFALADPFGAKFVSGAVASFFTHPFDSYLTRLQKNMSVPSGRMWMAGAKTKAFAVGMFVLFQSYAETCFQK